MTECGSFDDYSCHMPEGKPIVSSAAPYHPPSSYFFSAHALSSLVRRWPHRSSCRRDGEEGGGEARVVPTVTRWDGWMTKTGGEGGGGYVCVCVCVCCGGVYYYYVRVCVYVVGECMYYYYDSYRRGTTPPHPTHTPQVSAVFFTLFTLFTSFVVLSLFISVITMAMFEVDRPRPDLLDRLTPTPPSVSVRRGSRRVASRRWGLDWIGLDWIGSDRIGSDRVGSDRIGLDWL